MALPRTMDLLIMDGPATTTMTASSSIARSAMMMMSRTLLPLDTTRSTS